MNIYYISIGSFCYTKIIIRETNRLPQESLPFDFNSSPHLDGIINILKKLNNDKTYNLNLKEIMYIFEDDELVVKEEYMYLIHFFKTYHLKNKINEYPCNIDNIDKNIINEVKNKFKKRFERLYEILNDTKNIICFVRVENYDNNGWKFELEQLCKILKLFKNPNKFLIYTQNLIDENLDFKKTNRLNYDYDFPILFYKYYFYDKEILNNKEHFINLFKLFEKIINNENVINIINNGIIEKYYLNKDEMIIFKLSNIKFFSHFYINENTLFINNVINGYEKYIKNNNIFQKIS